MGLAWSWGTTEACVVSHGFAGPSTVLHGAIIHQQAVACLHAACVVQGPSTGSCWSRGNDRGWRGLSWILVPIRSRTMRMLATMPESFWGKQQLLNCGSFLMWRCEGLSGPTKHILCLRSRGDPPTNVAASWLACAHQAPRIATGGRCQLLVKLPTAVGQIKPNKAAPPPIPPA